jgi:hypothetical protein
LMCSGKGCGLRRELSRTVFDAVSTGFNLDDMGSKSGDFDQH